METPGFKYKLVTYQFEIPVRIPAQSSEKSEQVEAYYKSRDLYYNYTLNEATITVADIDRAEYERRQEIDQKLQNFR